MAVAPSGCGALTSAFWAINARPAALSPFIAAAATSLFPAANEGTTKDTKATKPIKPIVHVAVRELPGRPGAAERSRRVGSWKLGILIRDSPAGQCCRRTIPDECRTGRAHSGGG